MKNRFVKIQNSITLNQIEEAGFNLSSYQYKYFLIKNANCLQVKDFLSRDLVINDLGNEVGSINYIEKSPFRFVRTKALQRSSFLPEITEQSALPVHPNSFRNMNLKEGDVLISKDSNIGEIVILDRDYPNLMLSGAIYRLPIGKNKYYLLAMIKHDIFREQLDILVPKGSTIRHAKTMFLDCKIPIPTFDEVGVMNYVEILIQSIINKEKEIRARHEKIVALIGSELKGGHGAKKYEYQLPRYEELVITERLDTNLYRDSFKQVDHAIKNYKNGFSTIEELGFTLSRGQNLQVSNIGKSIYSKTKLPGFYTLMMPNHLSKYGTIDKVEYLGSARELKTLKKGDLIFGAEGFGKGRSIVIIEEKERSITNIHGITIKSTTASLETSIFVKCFLDYLRSKKMIDLFAVGGNGGSLAQRYWDDIPFPNFDDIKRKEIVTLYSNPGAIVDAPEFDIDSYLDEERLRDSSRGIHQLDIALKSSMEKLDEVIVAIANNAKVSIVAPD